MNQIISSIQRGQYKINTITGSTTDISINGSIPAVYKDIKCYGGYKQETGATPTAPKTIHPNNTIYGSVKYNQKAPALNDNLWNHQSGITIISETEDSITFTVDDDYTSSYVAFLNAQYRFNAGNEGDKVYYKCKLTFDNITQGYLRVMIGEDTKGGSTSAILTLKNYKTMHIDIMRPAIGGQYTFSDFVIINLTEMFGAGNEPTTTAEAEALFDKYNIDYNNQQQYAPNGAPTGVNELNLSLLPNGGLYGIDDDVWDEWNPITGEGIQRFKKIKIKDIIGNWKHTTSSSNHKFGITLQDGFSPSASWASGGRLSSVMCDCYERATVGGNTRNNRICYSSTSSSAISIVDNRFTTVDDFLAAMGEEYIIYKLNSRDYKTFTTTPQQIIQPVGDGRLLQIVKNIDNPKIDLTYISHV